MIVNVDLIINGKKYVFYCILALMSVVNDWIVYFKDKLLTSSLP